MGTLLEEATLPDSFLLPSPMGSTLKRKNLLLEKQILSFMSRSLLGRILLLRKANRKSQKVFPFVKMVGKEPIHLKTEFTLNELAALTSTKRKLNLET